MRTRSRLLAVAVALTLATLPALVWAQGDTPSGRRITPDPLDPNIGQGAVDPRAWTVATIDNLNAGSTLGTLWVDPAGTVYVWSFQQRLAAPALLNTPRFTPPDDSPIGGTGPPVLVNGSWLLAVSGSTSQVRLDLHGEMGATVYGTGTRDIYASANVAGGGVRLYHFNGQDWRLEKLPDGITGPAGTIAGERGKMFFRAGRAILEGHGRSWSVAYSNGQLLGGSELVYVDHKQVVAPCDYGQAVWNGKAWSWQPANEPALVNGAWGGRDAQGSLHLFSTGSDRDRCGMYVWQYDESTPGDLDGTFDLDCKDEAAEVPGAGMGIEVWGHAVHDIYAIGEYKGLGELKHFDGTGWLSMFPMNNMPVPTGIGDAPNGDYWIALSDGRLLHGVLKSAAVSPPPVVTAPSGGVFGPELPFVRPIGGRSYELEFSLAKPADVSLVVYSVAGRRVATLDRSTRNAGVQRVAWDARGVPRGVYLCRIESAGARQVARILIDR